MCTTSGWNCTPKRPLARSSKAAAGVSPVEAVTTAPVGGTVMVSKWLIHTGWCFGWAALNSTPSADDVEVGAAVLAPAGAGDRAAEVAGEELGAVADAQDRDVEVVDGRVDRRARPRRGPTRARRRR